MEGVPVEVKDTVRVRRAKLTGLGVQKVISDLYDLVVTNGIGAEGLDHETRGHLN